MLTRIYDPRKEHSIEGVFVGFVSFEFTESEETWLPAVSTDDGEVVALPQHYLIIQTIKAHLDELEEGKTRIRIEFVEGLTFDDSQRMIYNYRISFDGVGKSHKRILTIREMREKLLPKGGQS